MNKIYAVVFKDGGKSYFFQSTEKYNLNDHVIVETEKGLQYGKIIKTNVKNIDDLEYKKIVRKTTSEDYKKHMKNLRDAQKAYKDCQELIKKYKLNMQLINVQFNFDRTQLLFNFTANDRVDFRELAKKLASIYHTRIELRQIGARDKAKEVSGVGICGQKLCCSRFLNHLDAVVMSMAKNQNLALNPNKINGCCGRLLCCLTYEDELYKECSVGMPQLGSKINTSKGQGQVVNVNILERKYQVLIEGEKVEFSLDEENSKK